VLLPGIEARCRWKIKTCSKKQGLFGVQPSRYTMNWPHLVSMGARTNETPRLSHNIWPPSMRSKVDIGLVPISFLSPQATPNLPQKTHDPPDFVSPRKLRASAPSLGSPRLPQQQNNSKTKLLLQQCRVCAGEQADSPYVEKGLVILTM
jgi:hypothetical protein